MSVEARVQLRRGTLRLDVSLHADEGVIGLVGPNGAGKTTLLRALAGLSPLDAGRVVIGGQVVEDTSAGVRMPPERRRVGVVFQQPLLFAHLDVAGNVAFAPRMAGATRTAARRRASAWLERLDLAELARMRPAELSGGQAQLVALARALAAEPAALLLDEPLSALDVATRDATRRVLRRHLDDFAGPVVLVTHDPVEASTLTRRLVVLESGRVTQEGTVAELTAKPRSAWVARLAGVNLYRGIAEGTTLRLEGGGQLVTAEPLRGPAHAAVPPAAVALFRDRPDGTPRNVWRARIAGIEAGEGRLRVRLDGTPPVVAEITPPAAAALGLEVGEELWAAVKATEVRVYPA